MVFLHSFRFHSIWCEYPLSNDYVWWWLARLLMRLLHMSRWIVSWLPSHHCVKWQNDYALTRSIDLVWTVWASVEPSIQNTFTTNNYERPFLDFPIFLPLFSFVSRSLLLSGLFHVHYCHKVSFFHVIMYSLLHLKRQQFIAKWPMHSVHRIAHLVGLSIIKLIIGECSSLHFLTHQMQCIRCMFPIGCLVNQARTICATYIEAIKQWK